MARRNVLQEIPISVPQTEQQSYEIVNEEEDSLPYSKPIPSAQRPHSTYVSNDESKENITPSQLENILQEKSQVKILDGCSSVGDEPGAWSSSQLSSVNVLTPKRSEGSPDDLQPRNTPMDFSTVTVEDLDITSESFTTKCAGKSPKSLHKHRRRSTIGVRGSPEMNFLIRQIALQRSNRKSDPEPEGNPFSSPRNSLLREKIAAFRNAFQTVEETEGKLSFPGFSEVEELKSVRGSEPPEKRKKICDPSDLGAPSDLQKTSAASCPAQPLEKPVPEKTLESNCTLASRPLTEVPSKSVEVLTDEPQMLPDTSRSRKRKVMFAGVSPPEPEQSLLPITEASSGPVLKPALKKTPRRDFLHFRFGFPEEDGDLFSLHEEADEDLNNKAVDSVRMKKRVTFGRELSPEIFDKTLPANTPIRRGSTPYNYRKLDATPSAEESVCESPFACAPVPQPDFDDEEDTLQPVSLCFDAASPDSDSPAFFLPEHSEEGGPHEIGAAADIINESFIAPPEVSPLASTRQTRSRQKLTSGKTTPERNGSKSKVKTNAKKPKKSVIVKKVQIKVSRGKGKKKGRKSKNSVQKPVHSEREVVSRKPLLSPIPELPESIPTPPASTSQGFLYVGKTYHEDPMKKVHTEVLESDIPFTLEDSLERSFEEKDPKRPSLFAVENVQTQDATADPALVDVNVSNGSPEKSEEVLGLVPQADLVNSEGPQSSTAMDVIDQLTKPATSGPSSSSVEKISKTRRSKRRSSTCRSVSHASVNSENTVGCVKQDEGTQHTSHKPETSIDNPVLGAGELSSIPNELAEESSTTSYSKPPLSSITTEHKKSRRSSRIHQASNILFSNLEQKEQTTPGEHTAAIPPPPVDSAMNDFCLPIDEALHFPQPEKKVRRSMRLRRDSGVIGLSWVQDNDVHETTGRRKSVSSVTRLEESSALLLENTAHSPNKENLSSYHVANLPRRARRRTLCTTTIQESVSTSDKKQRRSNSFYKAPTSDEADHTTLVPDA